MRVIGHRFSKDTHDLRDFMARNRIPGRWLDVERDSEARELLAVAGVPDERLPVVLLEDGSVVRASDGAGAGRATRRRRPPDRRPLRPGDRRRRPRGPGRRGLRGLRGTAHGHGRARGPRRAGRAVKPHRELPRVPQRALRLRSGPASHRPGAAPRRRAADGIRRGGAQGGRRRADRRARRRGAAQRQLRAGGVRESPTG